MLFKTSLGNQLKALEFLLFLLIVLFGASVYAYFFRPGFHLMIFVWFFLGMATPVLFLHVEYLLKNRGATLEIQSGLRYKNGINEWQWRADEIARIVLYLPPSHYRGVIDSNFQLLPFEPYGYAAVFTKRGERLIITSLMVPNILDALRKLENIPVERKKRLFASPLAEKLLDWFERSS